LIDHSRQSGYGSLKFDLTGSEGERMSTGSVSIEPAAALGVSSWSALLCRVGSRSLAIPLAGVQETMRPLPVDPLPGLPDFVSGIAQIRGAVVPVVALGELLGLPDTPVSRYVTVSVSTDDTDGRTLALAVEEVIGVRHLDDGAPLERPPLLDQVEPELVAGIATLDRELLLVLGELRLLSDEDWAGMDTRPAARSDR
jgi:purine-binding chemotaxis protein CheW